jgi:hypothetical protein
MVQGVVEAAVQTAILVLSFGSSASATAMGSATRAAMTNAAKKSARRNAVMVSKAAFKRELKKTYKDIAKKAIKDAVKGKVDEKKQELMAQYAMRGADGMSEAFLDKVKKQGDNPALIAVKEVDPFGLADAIDTSISGDASANQEAAKWMNVISTVDPTGILGAVANFVKHNHCESTLGKMDAAAATKTEVPSAADLPVQCSSCSCSLAMSGWTFVWRCSWTETHSTWKCKPDSNGNPRIHGHVC